jgi:hypothetical protein
VGCLGWVSGVGGDVGDEGVQVSEPVVTRGHGFSHCADHEHFTTPDA